MATESLGNTRTMIAAADLSAQQYRGVARDASGLAIVAVAGAAAFVGVLQNAPIAGRAATVATTGRTKMVAGEAITLPAKATTDATGRAVVADTATNQVIGEFVGAASQAGQIVEVDLDLRGGTIPA